MKLYTLKQTRCCAFNVNNWQICRRGKCLLWIEKRRSQREIAGKLKIPRPTIQDFLRRFKSTTLNENLSRSDRSHVITENRDQKLWHIVINQSDIKRKRFRELFNLNVSIRTLRRRLRTEHIRKWKARMPQNHFKSGQWETSMGNDI